mmetsp:Transcript_26288/g.43047  ORF Transcript_26288/g.43047 Transcript_26288/m.43047 type:complete len:89 (+) Transcript_26288:2733-2999(+)
MFRWAISATTQRGGKQELCRDASLSGGQSLQNRKAKRFLNMCLLMEACVSAPVVVSPPLAMCAYPPQTHTQHPIHITYNANKKRPLIP